MKPWTEEREKLGQNTWKAHSGIVGVKFTNNFYDKIAREVMPKYNKEFAVPKSGLMGPSHSMLCIMWQLNQSIRVINKALNMIISHDEVVLRDSFINILNNTMDDVRDLPGCYLAGKNLRGREHDSELYGIVHYAFPMVRPRILRWDAIGSRLDGFDSWRTLYQILDMLSAEKRNKMSLHRTVRAFELIVSIFDIRVSDNHAAFDLDFASWRDDLKLESKLLLPHRCIASFLEQYQACAEYYKDAPYESSFGPMDEAIFKLICANKIISCCEKGRNRHWLPFFWRETTEAVEAALADVLSRAPEGRYDLNKFIKRAAESCDASEWFKPSECSVAPELDQVTADRGIAQAAISS